MHALKSNPGPRRLTNQLLSKLTWSTLDNSTSLIIEREYYSKQYKEYAEDWKDLYDRYALAIDNAKEMFAEDSLTYHLLKNIYWGEEWSANDLQVFSQFRQGGEQNLPILFQDSTLKENFRGLDESVVMLKR
jgi:hypothetical protein